MSDMNNKTHSDEAPGTKPESKPPLVKNATAMFACLKPVTNAEFMFVSAAPASTLSKTLGETAMAAFDHAVLYARSSEKQRKLYQVIVDEGIVPHDLTELEGFVAKYDTEFNESFQAKLKELEDEAYKILVLDTIKTFTAVARFESNRLAEPGLAGNLFNTKSFDTSTASTRASGSNQRAARGNRSAGAADSLAMQSGISRARNQAANGGRGRGRRNVGLSNDDDTKTSSIATNDPSIFEYMQEEESLGDH